MVNLLGSPDDQGYGYNHKKKIDVLLSIYNHLGCWPSGEHNRKLAPSPIIEGGVEGGPQEDLPLHTSQQG